MRRHIKFIAITAMGLVCLSQPVFADGFNFQKPSPLINKGEIYVRTATADVALPVGSDGQILSADASTVTGLKWVASPTGTGTVTNSGTLTSNAVIIGGGTTVVSAITADTTTTHALFATATSPAFRQVTSNDVTGIIGSNNGGTGQSTFTKGDILVGTTGGWMKVGVGANGTNLSADSSTVSGVAWVAQPAVASTTPGGTALQMQTNNSGSFGGVILVTADTTRSRLAIGPLTSTNVSLDVAGNFRTVPVELSDAAALSLDSTKSNFFYVTLGGSRTLSNQTNCTFGQYFTLMVSQDATGSRKLGMQSNFKFGTDVPSYDASTTAGAHDYIKFMCSNVSVDVVAVSKGYN